MADLHVRLGPVIRTRMARAARRRRVTVSAWVRAVLEQALGQDDAS